MPEICVLLVEDDDIIARVAEWRLKNLGYSLCGRATTGAEAMELVVRHKPDIVLMDINIRGEIDGIETAKMIKKGFNIPVVYYSTLMAVAYGKSGKEAGLDGQIIRVKQLEDIAER